MNLIINGAGGKMGKILTDMAVQNGENVIGADIAEGYSRLEDISADADCVIDFSNHKAAESVINYCVKKNLPVLIASTGHDENELKLIHDASTKIPVFLSSNMSLGVALLADLAERVTKVFGQCDIELIEAHHNQKLDVPSGTALTLAKRIQEADKNLTFNIGRHENGKRSQNEIGIHSLRYGSEVGTHEIIFSNGL
ncbi:MAG: 4-hydroxy-tetrahydrodipicolinate reductase, partial [Synergistaceae bacterium]|nr:4-hydroxy-tetrahydrodipicolinate reductase [Synergistaceae bacterium]